MTESKSKESHFFAHLARMKLIQRWPLMRSCLLYTSDAADDC